MNQSDSHKYIGSCGESSRRSSLW